MHTATHAIRVLSLGHVCVLIETRSLTGHNLSGHMSLNLNGNASRFSDLPGAPAELFPGWVKSNVSRPGWVKIEKFCCMGGSKSQIFSVYMVKMRKFVELEGGQVTLFDTACGRPW